MDKKTENNLPTIFESDTSNLVRDQKAEKTEGSHKGFSAKLPLGFMQGGRMMIVIFVLLILLELLFGAKVLQTPIPKITQLEQVSGGKIVLTSDKMEVPVGDQIKVGIRVTTGGRVTDGTDIVINYNPDLLKADEKSMFESGDIYSEFPIISNNAATGTIRISGIASSGENGFNGTGNFGTLTFKTKKNGSTTIAVAFTKEGTTDSNIIETKTTKDILSNVYNTDIKIGGKNLNKIVASNNVDSCQGYSQICWDADGNQGIQSCLGGRKKDNLCTWDPILTTDCGQCQITVAKN